MSEQRPAILTTANVRTHTEAAKERLRSVLELADDIRGDRRRKARLQRYECKACFYGSRLGGAAITTRRCAGCGEAQTYASTATDVLCEACARKYELCRHCGGDIDTRVRRKDWPVVGTPDHGSAA